jgi:hypothetical protein
MDRMLFIDKSDEHIAGALARSMGPFVKELTREIPLRLFTSQSNVNDTWDMLWGSGNGEVNIVASICGTVHTLRLTRKNCTRTGDDCLYREYLEINHRVIMQTERLKTGIRYNPGMLTSTRINDMFDDYRGFPTQMHKDPSYAYTDHAGRPCDTQGRPLYIPDPPTACSTGDKVLPKKEDKKKWTVTVEEEVKLNNKLINPKHKYLTPWLNK